MEFELFGINAIEHLNRLGYRFLLPDGSYPDNPEMYKRQMLAAALTAVATSVTFGVVGALSSSPAGATEDEQIKSLRDLTSLGSHAGLSFNNNACQAILLLDADGMSDEALVGRFKRIEEAGKVRRKHSAVMFRTWVNSARAPALTYVLTAFSDPDRAGYFAAVLASKCRSIGVLSHSAVYPYTIDLGTPKLLMPKLPLVDFLKLADAPLFSS